MSKRLRMTMADYSELTEARDWCVRNGFEGFASWYNLELAFQAKRRALPLGVQGTGSEDEREERGDRR